jgi:hypothetical protein
MMPGLGPRIREQEEEPAEAPVGELFNDITAIPFV